MMETTYGTFPQSTTVLVEEGTTKFCIKQCKKIFGMHRSTFLLLAFSVFYILFLISGAKIFSYFESEEVGKVAIETNKAIEDFLAENPTVKVENFYKVVGKIVSATSKGISVSRNMSSEEQNLSFGQSLLFVSTLATTIGYGNITPLTKSGKLFCIIFAIIGIPLTLMGTGALAQRLLIPTLSLLKWLHKHLKHLSHQFGIRLIHLIIMGSLLVGCFLLLPAIIFAYIEAEWDFLDSFYFCFITMTTVGLGDFIPGDSVGQSHRSLYKILTTCYLYLCLTVASLIVAVFNAIPQLNLTFLLLNDDDDSLSSLKLDDIDADEMDNQTTSNKTLYKSLNETFFKILNRTPNETKYKILNETSYKTPYKTSDETQCTFLNETLNKTRNKRPNKIRSKTTLELKNRKDYEHL